MAEPKGVRLLRGPRTVTISNPSLPAEASPRSEDAPGNSLKSVLEFLPENFLSQDTTINEIYAGIVHLFDPYGKNPTLSDSDIRRTIASSWSRPGALEERAKELRELYGDRSQEAADLLRLISQRASDAVKGYDAAIRGLPAKESLDLGRAEKDYLSARQSYTTALGLSKPALAETRKGEMEAAEAHLGKVRKYLDLFDRLGEMANLSTYTSALAKEVAPERKEKSDARDIYLGANYMEAALSSGLPVFDENPLIARAADLPPAILPDVKKSAREVMRY